MPARFVKTIPPTYGARTSVNRPLFFIALGLFGLYTVEFGIVGILPDIVSRFGVSVAQAGWLVGLFALIVAAFGPVLALWFARFDRRRVLAGTLLAFALCSALSAIAPNFAVLIALRIPTALLHPVFFSAAFATAVSLYPPERAEHATAMAFVGTSMGMVVGVPMTAWIAATVSFEASFLFCAIVNLVAGLALWWMLPASPPAAMGSTHGAVRILRRPAVLLALGMIISVFAAGFSVYSYAAEYLARVIGLDAKSISFLLVIFGCGGVAGNLIAGRLLGRWRLSTVIGYPVTLAIAYLVLLLFGSASVSTMLPICLLWGAAHTSGLVITQVWMTSAAPDEHAFATSLYLSAANVGVLLGAATGGAVITGFGLRASLWCGWLFALLALVFVIARLKLVRSAVRATA